MKNPVLLHSFATLLPALLILIGAFSGGLWILGALLYLTIFIDVLDIAVKRATAPTNDEAALYWGERLVVLIGAVHFVVLFVSIWAITANTGLTVFEKIGLFLSAGIFLGQISNSAAHELIHSADPQMAGLGKWMFSSIMFGHHVSAHPRVHHRYVATDLDPNSARLGESFYRFFGRAWVGSFRAGYSAERDVQKLKRRKFTRLTHPYLGYLGISLICAAIGWYVAGWTAVIVYVAFAFFAQSQLLLSDYIQHYGLSRRKAENGALEPLSEFHSWNAPQWFSGLVMLNSPRHSDHHLHPDKSFPELELGETDSRPTLPRSMPIMAGIALIPGLWRRRMDPLVEGWDDRAQLGRVRQGIT